jgi:trimethylamine--corrinoid protein Co-methyltransferase
LPIGAPERALLSVYAVNLGKNYGLPTLVAGGGTDAKMPGTRAGMEKTWTALPVMLAEADLIIGAGALDSAATYSYEQLVIDDEIAGGLARIAGGLEVNEETLALDAIRNVGIGGHFLAEKHTMTHVRNEQWFPSLYKRIQRAEHSWDFKKLGETDLAVEARNKAQLLLKTHHAQPLEKNTQDRIRELVDSATRQARLE